MLQDIGAGACPTFLVECSTCGVIVSALLSSTFDGTRQSEAAVRLGVVSRKCNIGVTKLTNLFTRLNAPESMRPKSYQNIATNVHDAATQAASDVMTEAAQIIRKTLGMSFDGDKVMQDVSVSFDGTWHKRSHTSHLAVGVAIELETGLALDYAAMSIVMVADLNPERDQEGTKSGSKHQAKCQKNFECSANAMKVRTAES